MGGKSSNSTQAVTIPPEVLARYNTINATADTAASRPFQTYSTDPSAFVAPMTATQQAGVANTNGYANTAQPYYTQAQGELMSGQGNALSYYGTALNNTYGAQAVGAGLGAAAYGAATGAQSGATPYYDYAGGAYQGAQSAGLGYTNQAAQSLINANGVSQPYYTSAGQNIQGAVDTGSNLNAQSYNAMVAAQQGANPYQTQSAQNYQSAQNTGAGLAGQSLATLYGAQGASNPLYAQALQGVAGAQGVGQALGLGAVNSFMAGQQAAQPFYDRISLTGGGDGGGISTLNEGLAGAKPFQEQAGQSYTNAYGAAQPFNTTAGNLYTGGLNSAQPFNTQAGQSYTGAMGAAQPLNNSAAGNYTGAMAAAQPLNQAAQQGIGSALSGASPYQSMATAMAGAGTQAVNPDQLNIQQYMSPYIQSVLNGTAGMLNQQNQQAMAGQTGNAIRSGAFGGDRAGIAAANLQQQQRVADASIFSGILNQGFTNAQGVAQQQQGVQLGASQANRAALQQGAGQMAAIGQQGYQQQLSAAQQQQALAQQLYGQQTGTGQAQAALAQQQYAQGMGLGQAQQGLGQQIFGQQQTAGQNQQSLGQQNYAQGMGLGQAQQGLGQQTFEQARGAGELQANIANMGFQQSLGAANLNASLAQQQFNQGLAGAQLAQGLGSQLFNQGFQGAQFQQGVGSTLYNQGLSTSQQQANVGQQQYAQGMGVGQAQQGLGQQVFSQGLGASQQLGALGQQGYSQGIGAAAAQQGLGQAQFQQGLGTSQQEAALGNQAYTQGMGVGQAQQGLGQAVFNTGNTTANTLGALGQQQFGQGMSAAQQQQAMGQGIYGMGANTSSALAGLGTAAQAAGLQGAQAQLGAGQVEQQTQQAGLQALYNQFLQQQSYPFQTAQFLANIGLGTGAQSGSTTTTTQPGGFFSDERLKENAEPIGKTFDGQNIYKFNYKGGDTRKQIGLMAQDVEKRHPGAVGEASGYKTVDYDKATSAAARKGKFYRGGLVANGGMVGYDNEGQGYAEGGGVAGFDPALMQQILSNSAGMYGPYMTAMGGSPYGGSGRVPAANLPVGQMMTAGPLPEQETTSERMAKIAALADSKAATKAVEWGKKKWKDRDNDDPSLWGDGGFARGGLAGFATGGMPYSDAAPMTLAIPDEKPDERKMLEPGQLPEHKSGMESVMDIAKIAAMFLPLSTGGRAGKAGGGASGGYFNGEPTDPNDPWYRREPEEIVRALKIAKDGEARDAALSAAQNWKKPEPVSAARPYFDGHATPSNTPWYKRDPEDIVRTGREAKEGRARNASLNAAQNWKPSLGSRIVDAFAKASPESYSAEMPMPGAMGIEAARPKAPMNWGDAPVQAARPAPVRSTRPSAIAARAGAAPPPVAPTAPMGGVPAMPQMPTANMVPQGPVDPVTGPLYNPELNQSMGQRFAGSEVGQGLGAAAGSLKKVGKKILNTGYVKDVREGKPEAVLSLLSAISAMGTAPTRSLGVALAAGLGQGVNTYTGVQKRRADIAQTQATTRQTGAETKKTIAGITGQPGIIGVENPDSPYGFSGVTVPEIMAPGSGPTGDTPSYNYLGKVGAKAITQARDAYFQASPTAKQEMQAQQAQTTNRGLAAQAGMMDAHMWANALAANKDGPLAPGALNPIISNMVSYWNSFADKLPPEQRAAIHIEGNDSNQIANKMQVGAAQLQAAGADMKALGTFQALLTAVPGTTQQRDAALALTADRLINAQRDIDLMHYQNEFDDAVRRQKGMAKGFSGQDVARSFGSEHPVTEYNREREALEHMLMDGSFAKIEQLLQSDAPEERKQKWIDSLNRQYGNGFHRYFTGGE